MVRVKIEISFNNETYATHATKLFYKCAIFKLNELNKYCISSTAPLRVAMFKYTLVVRVVALEKTVKRDILITVIIIK